MGTLDWEPLKMWHIVGSASFFTQSSSTDAFHRADPLNGTRWADASNTDIQRMKLEAYTNYSRTFADNHSLSAMVGYSYQRYDYRYLYAKSQGHATDKIPTLNAGSTYTAATSTKQKDINIGYFGRINYDYMKKYMLTLTFREDGSSRFAEGNQWGFFPGASAGWAMHAEDFMQPIEWINNLKWRVSYGQTGNNSVGYYDAFGLYSVTTSYDGQPAVITSAMPNPTLKWEKTTQLDAGFDFSVLNDRIALNVDYFNKITDNLITTRTLPNTSGFGSVLTNLGKVRFHGFDLELNTRNIVTNDFTWESKFTITYVKNKVLKLHEEEGENKRDKNRRGDIKSLWQTAPYMNSAVPPKVSLSVESMAISMLISSRPPNRRRTHIMTLHPKDGTGRQELASVPARRRSVIMNGVTLTETASSTATICMSLEILSRRLREVSATHCHIKVSL